MTESPAAWLADVPPGLHGALCRAAAGVPPNVALMSALMHCADPGEAEAALLSAAAGLRRLGDAAGAERLEAVLALLKANPQASGVVRSVLAGLDHTREASADADAIGYWAGSFDAAARQNAEGSVALYALGNPELLRAATAEIVERLIAWGAATARSACLDLGCGIGRVEEALAPHVARVVGIDIAPAMIDTARRRCADLPNAEFCVSSGRDLAEFPDAGFDLVLAVDSFPYIVQSGAGLAQRILSECARVLRPDGHLAILNYSYRGDPERDRAELRSTAIPLGLLPMREGTSDFALWDGLSFLLRKRGGAGSQGAM